MGTTPKPPKPRAINVAILAFETFATMPITGPMDILNKASAVWSGVYGKAAPYSSFNVELVALSERPLQFGKNITLRPDASIVTAKNPDVILIPSAGENVLDNLGPLLDFIPWIKMCSARGARIVSLCTGAFLLAETGLLDGRRATTHWFLADLFRRTYPKVKLHPERLIVDEGNVITSGAATSFLDLVLYLIELYNGHEAAILIAKAFLIEMGRRTQLPYTMLSIHKMHNDRQILWVQNFIHEHLVDVLTTEMLAQRLDMSVRNFDRRFRNAVGEAPSIYVQKLRVEKAKRLLETTDDTIADIMTNVGYEDERSFRRLFNNLTDLSPKAYRMKYGMRYPVHHVALS
jgi:transcriptional regulator GlxA family with amidase domain